MRKLAVVPVVLWFAVAGVSAADAHELSLPAAKKATKRLGNGAANRIERVAGAEVIGRTRVGRVCRARRATGGHRHRIVCTWYLHVRYTAVAENGRRIAGMPVNHLTCLSDVRVRARRRAEQVDRTTRCRAQRTPKIPKRRRAAEVHFEASSPLGYDVPAYIRRVERRSPPAALDPADAARARERLLRTGAAPQGPRIALKGFSRPTARTRRQMLGELRARGDLVAAIRTTRPRARRLAVRGRPDPPASMSLFGNPAGAFDFYQERDVILNEIDRVFSIVIDDLGGSYGYDGVVDVYELPAGEIITCGPASTTLTPNMVYCKDADYVLWESGLSQAVFRNGGDGAWAGMIAHEFGHGAQRWLGWSDEGALAFTLFREALADCFAGAWYYYEYASGYTDFLGTNGEFDGVEFVNTLLALNQSATVLDQHGDDFWRESWVNYGWNQGFLGCGQQASAWWYGIV